MSDTVQTSAPSTVDVHKSYRLADFDLSDMIACGAAIRQLGQRSSSMEDVASKLAAFLYHGLVDRAGRPCCPLIRCFKTHPLGELPPELAAVAQHTTRGSLPCDPLTRCLTLLGTAGDLPEWNDRKLSVAHAAIPLVSVEAVERLPMIYRVMQQMGLQIEQILQPTERYVHDAEQRSFNVFYVPDAPGSPYVPAKNGFVEPYKIQSVLGFGGLLPSGDLFFVLIFTRIQIDIHIAELFRTIALSVKLALLPFTRAFTFANEGGAGLAHDTGPDQLRSEAITLGLLIPELEAVALQKTKALKTAMVQLSEEAHLDGLTGLANRRAMDDVLTREFGVALQSRRPLAVLLIDVDHFKSYNDQFGHQAGDECLRAIGRLLLGCARRPTDFAARYGGEEFLLLLPDTDLIGALKLAELARATLQNAAIAHPGTVWGRVTLSVGCASVIPSSTDTANYLVEHADRNLYEAKRAGRNRTFPALRDLESPVLQVEDPK